MPYSHKRRTEFRIAVGRLILAALSLLAVGLGPAEAGHHPSALSAVLAGYTACSVLLLVLVLQASLSVGRLQFVAHAIDVVVFSVFIYLTEGSTSLLFVYFVFALIAGTLRWQWRGTLVTAAVTVAAFLASAILSGLVRSDPDFDPGRIIVGLVYLVVVAGLLAALGVHEARRRQEVGELAVWSRDHSPDAAHAGSPAWWLERATRTMGVRRTLFVWEDPDEPWLNVALWQDGHTASSRAAPNEFSPLVAPDLEDAVFECADARGGPAIITLHGSEPDLHRRHGPPVHRALADEFEIGSVISAPVNGEDTSGRLFFLDRPRLSTDDLGLASIVARGVSLIMVDSDLRLRLRASTALEERVRLAGDVHDGVLQSLAGIALQLETARRLAADDAPAAAAMIESVQDSLVQEQRDLRRFVEGLRPGPTAEIPAVPDLDSRLQELGDRVSSQWGIDADVRLENDLDEGPDPWGTAADDLESDVVFIVHEGLVNSARHGRATRAWATVRPARNRIEVVLGDDGHGFGFGEVLDMVALTHRGKGPRSLMQRVASRGGTLSVESGERGSRIEISLPLRAGGASLQEVG